jgi:hypothetical protein
MHRAAAFNDPIKGLANGTLMTIRRSLVLTRLFGNVRRE